ncbi:TetR/AcrR family transcriptional regulator [Rhizorhabdus dicambivorans]|uniref:TetR/AcrR family transcriptional regulator n=1 Tax=Rhizorhabdus dicambivorans TaxID=1850238 RepID=UPI0015968580|nr:TetR/AcrR family transcriptional regulator [Rhizorhabdus dicambivorans]
MATNTAVSKVATKGRARQAPVEAEAKAAPAARGGRKKSRAGADTRVKLLDAAERLFAEDGYDGTSLRDIANRAKLHLALSTYHFGTKEKLFEEVIQRRATEMEQIRLAELAKIDLDKLSSDEALMALIEAYALPMIRARYGPSRQWQAYVRLVSQLISVKRWVPLIRKYYDNCGRQFIAKFEKVLPHADHDSLLDSFSFMISNMLYVCSYTNRFDKQKAKHLSAKEDVDAAVKNFLRFTHAGFKAL